MRHLRRLVHQTPDAVPDELADHLQAVGLDVLLDRVRDVAQPLAGDGLLDTAIHRLFGHLDQALDLRADLPDPEADGGVADVAAIAGGHVDLDQVAVTQSTRAGYAV